MSNVEVYRIIHRSRQDKDWKISYKEVEITFDYADNISPSITDNVESIGIVFSQNLTTMHVDISKFPKLAGLMIVFLVCVNNPNIYQQILSNVT